MPADSSSYFEPHEAPPSGSVEWTGVCPGVGAGVAYAQTWQRARALVALELGVEPDHVEVAQT